MTRRANVKREDELYAPMREWLENYLRDKYKGHEIIVIDTHAETLDRSLRKLGIICDQAVGFDIQIDILGIAKNKRGEKLFFIEAKKTDLTIRDLGQLLIYCKLIDPEEAFLMTSSTLGGLDKMINACKRRDLLNFGNGKTTKFIKISEWDITKNQPIWNTMIPPI